MVEPQPDWFGAADIYVGATNGFFTVYDTVQVTVAGVNDAPGSFALETIDTVYINLDNFDTDILDQIFDFMIRDFSRYALNLYSKTNTTVPQKYFCKRMIRKPVKDIDRSERVLQNHIYSLKDQYEMNS